MADPTTHSRPESRLLLCCARTRPDAEISSEVGALARSRLDWDLVTRTAASQGVTALVYRSLSTICPQAVPENVLRDFRRRFQSNARRNLVLADELPRLLTSLSAAGIRVLPFKGPILAAAAYRGNLALRHFYDLDLLVNPHEVPASRDVLLSQGYLPDQVEGWEQHFLEPNRRWLVDLHARIAPDYFPAVGTFEELWQRRRPVALNGRTIDSLSPEDLFLVLSVQLGKDCREWKQRLVQICDAAELIAAQPELDWEAVLRTARQCGALRMLQLELHLTTRLLGAALPPIVAGTMHEKPVVAALAAEVRSRLFPEIEGPAEALRYRHGGICMEDSRFHLRIRERWRDRLTYLFQYVRNHTRLLATPTERDTAFFPLPTRLRFLAYAVRPIRVGVQWLRTRRLRSRVGDSKF